ncbi:hypothetical protein PV325_009247, partial [Microctonus aethiopoides]
LLSDGDVAEVRCGLETLKNSSIARGDGKIEYLETVTFMNVHSNCRKNYTNNLSITAFKRRQDEPSTSVSPPFMNTVSSAEYNVILIKTQNYISIIRQMTIQDGAYWETGFQYAVWWLKFELAKLG